MTGNTKQVIVPDIGDADDVEVIELTVNVGDTVSADDSLLVIESDKASMDIPTPFAGVVHSIAVALGDKVSTGQVVAEIAVDAGAATADSATHEAVAVAEPPAVEPEPDESTTQDTTAAAPSSGPVTQNRLEVRLPDVGDAGEVVVIEIDAQPGADVSADQMLLVVESDKASMDIVAPAAGQVVEVLVGEGDGVTEGSLLVVLMADTAGAAQPETPAATASVAPAAPDKPPSPNTASPNPSLSEVPPAPTAQVPATRAASGGKQTVYAGPAVRRLARELGVDLAAVSGTGARGRITKDDVSEYVKARLADTNTTGGAGLPTIPEVDFSKFGEIERQPLSRIMKRGASNLHRSWLNVVHVTQHDEADITELEAFRQTLKAEAKQRDVKITPLPFLLKACAYLLRQHPVFNSSLDSQACLLYTSDAADE